MTVAAASGGAAGFVGLGRMGGPMAGHLAAAGFELLLHDSDPSALARAAGATGAEAAANLAALGRCGAVLLMLPSSAEVGAVLRGDSAAPGLLDRLAPGALVIDCSSSHPAETAALAAEAEARGIDMVDAPVAGGVVFARDGSLDVLIGGVPAAIERARPLLAPFSRGVRVCGGAGSAHALKLLNNFVNAQALTTYAEAFAVAMKFGLDADTVLAALSDATTGRNHPLAKKIEAQVMSRAFASGMALSLIEKDVATARDLARRLGLEAPVLAGCHAAWSRGAREVGAAADQTEIVRLWEREAGVEIRRAPA